MMIYVYLVHLAWKAPALSTRGFAEIIQEDFLIHTDDPEAQGGSQQFRDWTTAWTHTF